MKSESLVIAGQLYCGEYVLEPCTRDAMRSVFLVGALSVMDGKSDRFCTAEVKSNHSVMSRGIA